MNSNDTQGSTLYATTNWYAIVAWGYYGRQHLTRLYGSRSPWSA